MGFGVYSRFSGNWDQHIVDLILLVTFRVLIKYQRPIRVGGDARTSRSRALKISNEGPRVAVREVAFK